MTTWKAFLETHKDSAEYDAQAESIQCIVSSTDSASTSFGNLTDHPSLVCITRSSSDKEIQATFHHETRKTSLLSSKHDNLALLGFGPRACAVRIEPKEMFKVWPNKRLPSFEAIMACSNSSDILELSNSQMKDSILEAHAILPPSLTRVLFQLDSYNAEEVLLEFVRQIKLMKNPSSDPPATVDQPPEASGTGTDEAEDSSFEIMDEAELANLRLETNTHTITIMPDPTKDIQPAALGESTDPATVAGQQVSQQLDFDTPDHFFEARYGRILEFLWGVTLEDKTVKPTKIAPCSTPSVSAWLDATHSKHLSTPQQAQLPPFLPPVPTTMYPNTSGLSNVATAMTKLSNEMAKKNEMEMKSSKESEKKKSEKAFENLSKVQQNIFTLITATKDDTDEDVEDLRPTDHVLTLLSQKINIKAQAQLQHLFKETNNICDISLAMCTQLKNGTIASHPSVNDLNGVSPLFLPERSDEERVTQELALRLEEQMILGKISDSDLKTITKCRFHFPNNFGEYQHCIKNFLRLAEILAGTNSILVQKLKVLVEHSTQHERSYKEVENDHWFFYASLLQFIHRRTQHFIHSTSHGLLSKMKIGKLDFSDLLEDIEDGDYIPVQPKWLKNPKRPSREQPNIISPSNNQGGGGANQRIKKKPRETIDNDNIVADLKCPSNLPYREIFHPANRRGIPEVPHSDGSIRCNNWFHRGWCTKDCSLKASHGKPLQPDEQAKCKDYLQKLIAKKERWRANGRGNRNEQG